jgi:hypothetical protein
VNAGREPDVANSSFGCAFTEPNVAVSSFF